MYKRQDIEKTPPVIPEEKIKNPPKTESISEYCRFCGTGLQFKEAEICPNCGMRLKEPQVSVPQQVTGKFADSCTSGCGAGVSLISGLIGFSLILAGIWTIASGKQAYYMNAYPWNMSIAWTTCLVLGILLLGFAIWLYRSTHVSDKV